MKTLVAKPDKKITWNERTWVLEADSWKNQGPLKLYGEFEANLSYKKPYHKKI